MSEARTVGWRDWHRKSLEIRQAKARARGEEVLPLIQAWRQDGRSWAKVAELLDAAGIRASRGGRWHPDQLRRVWARWLRGELRLLLPSQSRHFSPRSAETHVQSVPRRRCFTTQAHGTTWTLSAAAAKTTLGLAKFTQGAFIGSWDRETNWWDSRDLGEGVRTVGGG